MKRLLVPFALLALAALALSACGGGGGSGAEGEITEAIEAAATTSAPSNCTKLQTVRFDEQNSDAEGKAAVKACEEEAKEEEEKAEGVSVENVSVNGENATAEVLFEGGTLDAQTLEIALAEEGGSWKLDQIEGFAKYDGKTLEEEFLKRFEESPEQLTKPQYTCIAEGIGNASKAEAEEFFLSGESAPIEELAKGCVSA
jgi:ABC-type glycerol-3-phosphate transport system substrate-binding protein